MQSGPDSSPSGPRPPRSDVNIEPSANKVRVTLSMPQDGGRRPDRKKILEKARRMLAAALDEERRIAERQVAQKTTAALPRHARPGGGAWWLF